MKYIFFLFACIYCINAKCQSRFDNYISSTVNISFDRKQGASGFLFNSENNVIYLVSTKHTFFEYEELSKEYKLISSDCELTYFYQQDKGGLGRLSRYLNLEYYWLTDKIILDEDSDVVAIKLGEVKDSLVIIPFQVKLDQDNNVKSSQYIYSVKDVLPDSTTLIGNNVFIFGYPRTVGLISRLQYNPNRPLVRSGIVASENTFNKTIIIDVQTFKGNSGGPVIQNYNYGVYSLIGIVSEYLPYDSDGGFIGNSGFSVVEPISKIIQLIEKYEN